MTFEQALVVLMLVAAVFYLLGLYGQWSEGVRRRKRRRLIERLGRERSPW